MLLSEGQLRSLVETLASDEAEDFLGLIRARLVGQGPTPEQARTFPRAIATGLVEPDSGALTELGEMAGQSFREYLQWVERRREMPSVEAIPELRPEGFSQLDVIDVGSGFGCNLLSIAPHAASTVGVEIEPLFAQLSLPLARLAGEDPPSVHVSPAEHLPLEDHSADAVLCIGALQYMDIEDALAEMARVLRPGGRLIIVFGHLTGYLVDVLSSIHLRSAVDVLREARAAATTLTYPLLGRSFGAAHSAVYPTHRRMRRWVSDAGLQLETLRVVGNETVYVARR